MPSEQNIMLVGRHGIGKSQILTHYFEEKGMKVVTLFLGQMSDPGDLIGLPVKNTETGHTDFMPPYWFPIDDQPVVLFLDELNRARPEVLQTIMDLALNRKLAGRALPKGSRLISAVNNGEEYQLTDLDPALVSRFNIYQFSPSPAEWLLWAAKAKLDTRVTGFIESDTIWLDGDTSARSEYSGLEKSPDRRAWHKVSDAIKGISDIRDVHKKMIAGIVGAQATAKFMAWMSANKSVSALDILTKFAKLKKQIEAMPLHELSAMNEAIYRLLETQEYKARDKSKVISGLNTYIEWLSTERKEAMAHFTSVFETGKYAQAIVFMMTETPEVYSTIMQFIKTL